MNVWFKVFGCLCVVFVCLFVCVTVFIGVGWLSVLCLSVCFVCVRRAWRVCVVCVFGKVCVCEIDCCLVACVD